MYGTMRDKLRNLVCEYKWDEERVMVTAETLTPEEAIGNPEKDDYPILRGRERIMEAKFHEARGHAFTDMYGNYQGTLGEIVSLELKNNFRRAIFVAALNAVLRSLTLVDKTVHCKDKAPKECAKILAETVRTEYGHPKIALVGFQPRMAEMLADRFPLKITDMDEENVGTQKFAVSVDSAQHTQENIDWCDLLLVTGSTAVNNTLENFLGAKPAIFYGVTVAGPAYLLGLNRFCPFGR